MDKYPIDFEMTAFADWGIDRHTVTGEDPDWSWPPYGRTYIEVLAVHGRQDPAELDFFEWRAQPSRGASLFTEFVAMETSPWSTFVDDESSDSMEVHAGSPSEPASAVDRTTRKKRSDDPFVDVVVYP